MSEEKNFTTHRTEDEAPGMSYTAEKLFQHRQIKLLESIDRKLGELIQQGQCASMASGQTVRFRRGVVV